MKKSKLKKKLAVERAANKLLTAERDTLQQRVDMFMQAEQEGATVTAHPAVFQKPGA